MLAWCQAALSTWRAAGLPRVNVSGDLGSQIPWGLEHSWRKWTHLRQHLVAHLDSSAAVCVKVASLSYFEWPRTHLGLLSYQFSIFQEPHVIITAVLSLRRFLDKWTKMVVDNLFLKGLGGKYFWFCGLQRLCYNYSILILQGNKQPQTRIKHLGVMCSNKAL